MTNDKRHALDKRKMTDFFSSLVSVSFLFHKHAKNLNGELIKTQLKENKNILSNIGDLEISKKQKCNKEK